MPLKSSPRSRSHVDETKTFSVAKRYSEETLDQISNKHSASLNEKHAYAKIKKNMPYRSHGNFTESNIKPLFTLKMPSKSSPRPNVYDKRKWSVAKATLMRLNLLDISARGGSNRNMPQDTISDLRLLILKSVSFIEEIHSLHEVNVQDEEDVLNLVADYLPKRFSLASSSPTEMPLIPLLQRDTKLSAIWTTVKHFSRISTKDRHEDNFNAMTSYCYALSAYLIRNIIRSIAMPDLVDMWTEIFNGFISCGDAFSESAHSKETNNCTHLLRGRIFSLQEKAYNIYRANVQSIRHESKVISSSINKFAGDFDWDGLSQLEQFAYGKSSVALQSYSKYIDSPTRDDVDKLKYSALEYAGTARLAWFEAYRFFCKHEKYFNTKATTADNGSEESEGGITSSDEDKDEIVEKRSFLVNQLKSWMRAIVSHDLEFWGHGLGLVLGSSLPRKDLSRFPYCSILDSKQRREAIITPESERVNVVLKNVTLLRTMTASQFVLVEAIMDKSGEELQRSYCVANYLVVYIPFDDRNSEIIKKKVSELCKDGRNVSCKVKEWPGRRPKCKVEFSPLSIDNFYCVSDALKALGWSFEPDYLRQSSVSRAEVLQQKDCVKTSLPYNLQDSSQGGIAALDAWATCYLNHPQAEVNPVVVAVIDTGIFDCHRDLKGNMWSKTLTADDKKKYFRKSRSPTGSSVIHGCGCDETTYTTDFNGHGTQVAGVVGGDLFIDRGDDEVITVSGEGIGGGVAENVKLMACKATNDPNDILVSNIANCIAFARENGARVINMSMEGCCYSDDEYEELRLCQKEGVIVVASAGNNGVNLEKNKVYPACYPLDNVITVAASTKHNKLWKDSNYGLTEVDLSAPGENISSTTNDHSGYVSGSGTSLAAPHVTAALAMLIQKYPKLSYIDLIRKIKSSTDSLVVEKRANERGRLNVHSAVLMSTNPPAKDSSSIELAVKNISDDLENIKIQSVQLIGKICELKEKVTGCPTEKTSVDALLRKAQENLQSLVDELIKEKHTIKIDGILKELVDDTMEETVIRARLDASNLI